MATGKSSTPAQRTAIEPGGARLARFTAYAAGRADLLHSPSGVELEVDEVTETFVVSVFLQVQVPPALGLLIM